MNVPRDPIEFWTAFGALGAVVAAAGTLLLIFVAFQQIRNERSARLKAEQSALASQRTAQAQRISGWIGGDLRSFGEEPELDRGLLATPATLHNGSSEPVYQVLVWLIIFYGSGPRTGEEQEPKPENPATLATLPPGTYLVPLPSDWVGMYRHPGVEVAFTDAAGRHWVRRATGVLQEIPEDPVHHYGIPEPVAWGTARSLSPVA